jgi:RNA polymerase sigma-70 factor, ECF subfamily
VESARTARARNAPAFEAVYAQNARFVWRVLRGLGTSDALVEDAVQDVFLVVHRRLADFDGRYSIRAWLFAIARRVARDHRRHTRRVQRHEPIELRMRDAAPMPDESAERSQSLRLISELLDQLDEEKRTVLVLTEIEGMTAQEIVDATGVGLNTVYTRLRRARHAFDKMLLARSKGRA